MNPTFLNHEKALIVSMVQGVSPDRVKYLMDQSVQDGAEAFGMQFERMQPEFRNATTYRELFAYAKGRPIYVTNYRTDNNAHKSDEVLAEELVEFAALGATLCDVMGDYFDRQPSELTMDDEAVEKQEKLIDRLHEMGAEVMMSTHVLHFTPAQRVLEIALEHQRRGADIAKIVTGAQTMTEQIENLRIIHLLKENLTIPFLFLAGGECRIMRRVGGELGCCMYLAVHEHDELATPVQPLIKQVKTIRENWGY